MIQKHSFFSRPLTFFGSHQHAEDENMEWNFSDPLFSSLSELQTPHPIKTGLFILWSDSEDTDEEIHFS
jgi:hypothetical protein